MDSAAFIDEPTIIQRILYKEKSDLKSLAQKCLELEKSDYSKISQSQREDLIVSIQEDFNSLEQITEKQSILHELYLSEKEYHVARQEVLAKEIEKYVQEVAVLRQELENEKSQRANLLEYETYAKQINGLPRCEDTNEAIQKVMKMYGEVNELIGKKTEILKGTEKKSLEIMEQLKGLIEGTGEDCMEDYYWMEKKCGFVKDCFVIEYCKQAMQHIEKSDAGLAVGLLKKAKYMVNTEKIRNLPLAKSIISHSYGLLYKALGKRSTALNSFLQSIEYAKYGGNSLTLSSSHLNISLTYSQYFQYNKALSHGLLALKLCENRSGEILDIYHCIGTIYKHQNNHLCALKYFSLGSQISKKTTGKKSVHSFRLAREEKKIIKKTNLNSIIQSSPRPQSKIYEFLFNSSRHSPKRTQTPPPWSYSEDPNSIFTRLDNN